MLEKPLHNIFYFALFLTLSISCGSRTDSSQEIIIASGANLQFALTEIADIFTEEYPYPVTFVWGSTGSLTHQIENGAPYDIFFAADESFMNRLREEGYLLGDSAQSFVTGRLAIGVNSAVKNKIRALNDFLNGDIRSIAIASPEHAPYGLAAKEALINAGLWEQLQNKIVYAENIRQCLQFIETGNADAGIVSANIPPVEGVSTILVDSSLYTPPRQSFAILKKSGKAEQAQVFLSFIKEQKSVGILTKYSYRLIKN